MHRRFLKNAYARVLFGFFCLFCIPSVACADPFISYLAKEKLNLNHSLSEANKVLSQSSAPAPLDAFKKENQNQLTIIRATIASFEGFLANSRKLQQNLNQSIKKIEQMPSWDAQTKEQLARLNQQDLRNNQQISLIIENLALARRYQNTLLTLSRQIDVWQARSDEQKKLDDLGARIKVLEAARDALYLKNVQLQNQKDTQQTNVKILLNNQSILLIQSRITGLELETKLLKADYSFVRNPDLKTIQSVTEVYKNALSQLTGIADSLKKMLVLLKSESTLISEPSLKLQLQSIQETALLRQTQIGSQLKVLTLEFEKKKARLKQMLSSRQGFAEYHLEGWKAYEHQFLMIPSKPIVYIKNLAMNIWENIDTKTTWEMSLYWVGLVLLISMMVGFRFLFRDVSLYQERSRLSGHLYSGLIILFHRNLPQLTAMALMVLTFVMFDIPYPHYQLVVDLMSIWLMFRSLILIARMLLLETTGESSGLDTTLYYRLRLLLTVGGWVTAFMVFAQQMPLSLLLQDIFNRLFMLFLLGVSLVMMLSKDVIRYLLRHFLKTKKRYFRHAVSLSAMLIPLILFSTAIIGLIGYIHLAWTLSRYLAYLLLLLTGYVLVKGLMLDTMEFLSEKMISSMRNGWLWIEVFLKPLDKIITAVLFVLVVYLIFQLFGWYSDAFVMGTLETIGRYPLVDISGVHITFLSLFKFFILVCVLVWMSKWTREFCYRRLYRQVSDAAVRNSFSVFTQYTVIAIGSIITLRVLGLDFSGMSMVIGGLAVGMGFGLRDFASNIVGGIMLLIERPVREGDLITLGEYEGRVAHIGIRSMRVSSWDNMEVLIPNAETFNKPFTNWTHQDSVVRTVVPIKVSRADDPWHVQQLILRVSTTIPEILPSPEVQVFLKQIDEALIEFELRYYINVQLHSRFEIRSKVLFALMEEFKKAGVKAPIPPLSIEIQ